MLAGSREAAVQCRIVRDKSSKLYPKYQLLLESGTSFLMSARKRKKSKSSNYILSFDEEDTARFSANFAGKVRANFLGTEFTVYDKGQKPQKAGQHSEALFCTLSPDVNPSVMDKTVVSAVSTMSCCCNLGSRGSTVIPANVTLLFCASAAVRLE